MVSTKSTSIITSASRHDGTIRTLISKKGKKQPYYIGFGWKTFFPLWCGKVGGKSVQGNLTVPLMWRETGTKQSPRYPEFIV